MVAEYSRVVSVKYNETSSKIYCIKKGNLYYVIPSKVA